MRKEEASVMYLGDSRSSCPWTEESVLKRIDLKGCNVHKQGICDSEMCSVY